MPRSSREAPTPEQFLSGFPPEIAPLSNHLRGLIRRAVPDPIEAVYPGWKLIGYPGAQRAYEPWEFQQEGTARQPQSIMQMNMFAPGQPVNPHVVLPVSGSDAGQENP